MDQQNIPIDINANKLLDWLTSRRHIGKDWQNNLIKIREKINNAIQDMPAHEGIIKLLSGQHINYFHCLKIIEILKETEADTKNLFGRYGSQRMKDWQEIVSGYQKENLYLAEVAQILVRNVVYEIPSLKKQVLRLEHNMDEMEKKLRNYSRAESIALREFNVMAGQLGVTGKFIRKECMELVNELPKLYEGIAEKVKIVKPAIELYKEFNKYLSGKNSDVNVLNTLIYLIENGNTTTYQYKYGQVPSQIEEYKPEIKDSEPYELEETEIDFGDTPDNPPEIDFDITSDNTIDFNITVQDSNGNSSSANSEEFEILEMPQNFEESGIVVENPQAGIAKGEEAFTILDNPKIQEQIINNLMELSAFLKMRLYEMSNDSKHLDMFQMQDAPTILQMQTLETITAHNDCVNVALNELLNKRLQHLHNIKHNPKYIDILVGSLMQHRVAVNKATANQTLASEKISSLREEIRKTKTIIDLLVENTKQLQQQIKQDISNKYNGRVVNLIGVSNVL